MRYCYLLFYDSLHELVNEFLIFCSFDTVLTQSSVQRIRQQLLQYTTDNMSSASIAAAAAADWICRQHTSKQT